MPTKRSGAWRRVQPSECRKSGPRPRPNAAPSTLRGCARSPRRSPPRRPRSTPSAALPEPIIDALIERGLLRMLLPRSLGGAELLPAEYVPVIEELAKIDASAAWCVNQNSGCSMTAVHLKPEIAREIFGGPARHPGLGSGTRRGARRAGRLPGHRDLGLHQRRPARELARLPCAGRRGRRNAAQHADGTPVVRTMLFPKSATEFTDMWLTIGLRGTAQQPVFGQGSVRAGGLFGRCPVAPRRAGGPVRACCTASAICSSMPPASPGWRSASAARRSNISSSWRATRSRAARRRRCATTT